MIACHCNAVCDRTVLNAVASGATSIDALGEMCGAGVRCGGCHDALDTLVAAAQAVDAAFGTGSGFGSETTFGTGTSVGTHPGADTDELREAAVG